jgi:hypothetical protein
MDAGAGQQVHRGACRQLQRRAGRAPIKRSVNTVYERRTKDAAFRAGWDKALAIGYARLEMMMLERALHGVETEGRAAVGQILAALRQHGLIEP